MHVLTLRCKGYKDVRVCRKGFTSRQKRAYSVGKSSRSRCHDAFVGLPQASSEAAWAAEKSSLEAREAEAARKAAQLEQQNRLLLDRLEAQRPSAPSPPRTGAGSGAGEEEDIQSVLRYLRREKETVRQPGPLLGRLGRVGLPVASSGFATGSKLAGGSVSVVDALRRTISGHQGGWADSWLLWAQVETALALAQQEGARWRSQAEQASKAAEEARAELAVMADKAHRGLQQQQEHRALLAQVRPPARPPIGADPGCRVMPYSSRV